MQKREALQLVDDSLSLGDQPRVHPNGFIQLELDSDGNRRLHVWRNDLPRQKVYTPVHNHRFDFSSITIAGALTNMTFELDEPGRGPLHRMWEVRRDPASEETKLMPTSNMVGLVAVKVGLITPGEGYNFSAGAFHETGFVHNTVTMIEKSQPYPDIKSAVLVPEGINPDNSFTRALPDTEDLYQKIREALS